MKRLGPIIAVVVAVVVVMIIRNASGSIDATPDRPTGSTPPPGQVKIIIGWVKDAPIRHQEPATPYDRDDFPHWRDADDYGWTGDPNTYCDAREAALVRDGRNVRVDSDTCEVTAGTWRDPYTGRTITDPSDLDVDHVVPLAAAYRAGADTWTEQRRTRYANNPGVVLAVSGSANRSKGDQTPAEWRPSSRAAWCSYGSRWAAVKHRWRLAYESQAEKRATIRLLNRCGK